MNLEADSKTQNPDAWHSSANAIPDSLPGSAFVYDGTHGTFRFNALAAEWFGWKEHELPCTREELSFELFTSDEQFAVRKGKKPWERALNGEQVLNLELELRSEGQVSRIVLCNASPLHRGTNPTPWGALVTLTDITALRAHVRHLAQEVKHLDMILEGTSAGTWEWNIQTGETRFNERWAQIAGYTLAELAPVTVETWLSMVHPEDLKKSRALLQRHFSGELHHYDLVGRMRHKDGHWVWVHARGRVYQWDEDGSPLWMAGTHRDISSIHKAEEEVRASQAYMQALIDASSDVAIIATDTQGLITVFNTGAEKLLNYSANEMVGKWTPELFHLESEVVARGKELSQEEGREIQGFEVFVHNPRKGRSETRRWTYVTRSGEHCTVSLSASAVTDGRGNIIGFLGMAVDETAQLAAEEKARLAAERFAGAFDSTAIGMALVSLEGRWMEVNGALCEMLGYSENELLKTDFQTLTYPDDLQNDLDLLNQLLADQIPNYEMQKRYFRKNGELIRAKLWVSLVRDKEGAPLHFVSQIQNITDEYLQELALQSSEGRLRGLFDLSPIGIGLMDYRSGRILEANDAVIAPSGYTREEFMALTDRELTPREYAPSIRNAIEQLQATGRYTPFEKEYIRKDGSRYPVLVQGILMRDPSGRKVIWSLVEDISERKRLDRIKNEFVSTVSHELRTPLTSISGALSLITSGVMGEINEEVLQMLNIAARSSERLTQLVNDLLDMDKLLAGKMELDMQQVDLLPLLDDAIRDLQAFARARKVEIVLTHRESMEIRTDSFRLMQVLNNLLSNACKHSDVGGTVELQHIAGPEDSVIISIIDHGHGIPKHFRSRIFQKFAQADTSDASEKKGTGLGLAICKELVERMGGVIGFESGEGKGSHFWIRMPRAGSRLEDDKRKPRVLHVEDDEMFARLVSSNIARYVDVDLATDLAHANELIRLYHYDLLLLDLFLPDGHGEALWEALHLAQPAVPIVVLSGHEVPRTLAGNVAAVLTKDDATLSRVVSTLERIFEMGEGHS